ncbi:MAG: hypothetical protein ACI4QT_07095 [Kiritimatiellia bacterium]
MATNPATINGTVRGVDAALTGCIIQSYSTTEAPIVEQVADQNGAIGAEVKYDTRTDISLTVIASSSTAPSTIPSAGDEWTFDGSKWFVDSVQKGQTYNAATQWTIAAHKYDNTPA